MLAGLYGALRLTGETLTEQRLLFFGAGEAGIGIANLVVAAMVENGLSETEARERCWFVDSKGLVVNSRDDLAEYKRPFAQDHAFLSDGVAIIETVRPTALIGVTGKAGAFSQPILQTAARSTCDPSFSRSRTRPPWRNALRKKLTDGHRRSRRFRQRKSF